MMKKMEKRYLYLYVNLNYGLEVNNWRVLLECVSVF